jgi:hypothetical protein
MAHRILDNLSWLENIGQQSADGYLLKLDGAVASLASSEEDLVIVLTGGAKIVIHKPVQPQTIGHVTHAGIREAVVTPDGTLHITFDNTSSGNWEQIVEPHAWKVYFPNGSSVTSLDGGGVELLPPDPASR